LGQSTSKKQLKIFKFEMFSELVLNFLFLRSASSGNSKHNISSTPIIFLLNYCRKVIPNVFLAGLFSVSDFFTFFGKKWPFSGEECGGQTLSKLQKI
jgi:hypothetical protein